MYREKDYSAEAEYIDTLLKKYSTREVTTILDFGCGTGGHAFLLAQKGYMVTGVDRSEDMLSIAREKAKKFAGSVNFVNGDIRHVSLPTTFDAVVSMFAVMGYQTTNESFVSALRNSWKHLNKNGILIFDVWFGPAVISQKPHDKILIIEEDNERIIRFTHPELDIMKHTVDVNFNLMRIRNEVILDHVEETHKMRYFFTMELKFFLKTAGYQTLAMFPFMEFGQALTEDDWDVAVVARKVETL